MPRSRPATPAAPSSTPTGASSASTSPTSPPTGGAVSIGFAIPSATVVDVVKQLLDNGKVEHAFLGIQPADLTPQIAQQFRIEADAGVIVLDVVPGSAAEKAGLESGDLLTSADGTPLRRVEDLLALVRRKAPRRPRATRDPARRRREDDRRDARRSPGMRLQWPSGAGSSNGRTPDSGSGSWGSNPCPAASRTRWKQQVFVCYEESRPVRRVGQRARWRPLAPRERSATMST
jgi:PDZ domain